MTLAREFDIEECACMGGGTRTVDDMEECIVCGTRVAWDLVEHPFFGFGKPCATARKAQHEVAP